MIMKVSEALKQRRSTRAFLQTPVEQSKIEKILEYAKWSPSGVNMQPWQVYVISGAAKNDLAQRLLTTFHSGEQSGMDYQYYPNTWKQPFKGRRITLGQEMFSLLGIEKEDKDARLAQWARNYIGFDAPTILIFTIDESLEKGSYLDYGMFLQSIMLMAEELGLSTCPQASLVEYPSILKTFLNTNDNEKFLCGISLGYADKEAIINQLHPKREDLSSFVKFID